MKRRLLLLLISALLAPLAACASAQAKAPIERPNLDVPPPPPRVIEPAFPAETPTPDPVADLPAAPTTAKPRPATPTRDTSKPAETPKPEPVTEQPPVSTPPPAPLPPLRTPNSPDAGKQVQEVIDRALAALNAIDYRVLTNERRAQYDNAKLLVKQAEDAVKAGNFDFAKNLADKAERIAKELQARQ
jgi:outer membrane biosynthesis protein TonB